jgi:hypothetical protein
MKLDLVRKIPLLIVVVCIALAVVITETIAAIELAHHDCTHYINDDCTVCHRVKAAADFLDTLRLACLFAFFYIFILFIPEIITLPIEFILVPSSPISLKDRSNT